MKKHLIAAAVAAAVAVPAMAQVTISGAIGGNSTKYKTDGASAPSESATTANDHLGTTALRISGAEDLGQGMKASFVLEGDLSLSSGLGSNNSTSDKDNVFNRFANVSLSGALVKSQSGVRTTRPKLQRETISSTICPIICIFPVNSALVLPMLMATHRPR